VLVFDAAGLGLFCVTGTQKHSISGSAHFRLQSLGLPRWSGAVLRDIVAREIPALVNPRIESLCVKIR
jgi:uncharacterized membrane protein YeiH